MQVKELFLKLGKQETPQQLLEEIIFQLEAIQY
jgi:hypothetical protein